MVSESQERMLAVVEPERVDEVLAVCERWQTGAAVVGEVTDSAPSASCATARSSARCRSSRWSTTARYTTSRRRSPRAGSTANSGAAVDLGRPIRAETLAHACSRRRASPASDGPLSSTTRSSGRTPCAGPRPPTRPCCISPRPDADDRDRDRRQRAPRRLRSLRGHDRGGARVRPEPRLRRRRAARPHQLPELRQPREADGRVAARPRRPRRSPTPARRSAIPVVGGNVSLYNETEDGPIYPTPVVGMVGELPDPASAPGPGAARGRRDRARRPVRAIARGLRAGEAAGRARARACPSRRSGRGRSGDHGSSARRCASGAVERRPRHQRRRPGLRAGRDGDRRRRRRGRRRSATVA